LPCRIQWQKKHAFSRFKIRLRQNLGTYTVEGGIFGVSAAYKDKLETNKKKSDRTLPDIQKHTDLFEGSPLVLLI